VYKVSIVNNNPLGIKLFPSFFRILWKFAWVLSFLAVFGLEENLMLGDVFMAKIGLE